MHESLRDVQPGNTALYWTGMETISISASITYIYCNVRKNVDGAPIYNVCNVNFATVIDCNEVKFVQDGIILCVGVSWLRCGAGTTVSGVTKWQ